MNLTGFCFTVMFSQNNVATTSAAFLEIGPGARSLGMGSAFVSVADDASLVFCCAHAVAGRWFDVTMLVCSNTRPCRKQLVKRDKIFVGFAYGIQYTYCHVILQ